MSDQEYDISWALKILEKDPDYQQNLIAKHFHVLSLGFFGAMVPACGNLIYRRPIWAGLQGHVIGGLIGGLIGYGWKRREVDILATRDARLRDYIMRHPEDFPPPVRKTFGETFQGWVPIR